MAVGNRKLTPVSWYGVLLGCFLVWVLNSVPGIVNAVTAHKFRSAALIGLAYLLFCLYVVVLKKRRDPKTLLGLILLGGFLLRSLYVLAAPYNISKHDIGEFAGPDAPGTKGGHLGYIEYLYTYRHLPDFDPRDLWSFSNPPGFHILAAAAMGLSRLLGVQAPLRYESVQIVNLIFSNLTVLALCRILEEFSVKGKWLLLLGALLSFHPFFMILAVTANNDAMMTFFVALAILYTLRWRKAPGMRNILVIALAMGLAMLAKLNAATAAFGIGLVFLLVFWKNRRDWKNYFLQFAVFALICVPLGLAFPVRNMLRFQMPLLYVQQMSPTSTQYIGGASLLARLVPGLRQWAYPFATFNAASETNIFVQTLRTALFDELQPGSGSVLFWIVGLLALWVSAALCLATHAALGWSLCKKGAMEKQLKPFLLVTYGGMLLFYLKFCLDEPFICTMNYRYLPLAILFPCIGAGVFAGQAKGAGTVKKLLFGGICLFCALTVIVDVYLILFAGIKL